MEELEKVPDWLTTRITYLLPNSRDSKEVRNYQPITFWNHVQDPNRNNRQKISTRLKEQNL